MSAVVLCVGSVWGQNQTKGQWELVPVAPVPEVTPPGLPEVRPEIGSDVREHIDIPSEDDVSRRYDQSSDQLQSAIEDYMYQKQKRAEHKDNPLVDFKVGYQYENGLGVPQDYAEAMRWYLKAAKQGNANASFRIASLYFKGIGVPQDYQEAMKWSKKAADQGNDNAECAIGYQYENGLGVPLDYAEAMKWYLKAEKGVTRNDNAAFCIALLYFKGRGVPQDYHEAMKWSKKAADQGNDNAECAIGYLYENGLGVPQDNAEAMKWYLKAAVHGKKGANNADRLRNKIIGNKGLTVR
jgi:TPR repeat protein